MANLINYNGNSKVIKRICELLNNGLIGIKDVLQNGKSVVDSEGIAHIDAAPLGTNHNESYYGDLGQIAYEHSQINSGNPHNVTLEDLGIANIQDQINLILDAIGGGEGYLITTDSSNDDEPVFILDHEGDYINLRAMSDLLAWH